MDMTSSRELETFRQEVRTFIKEKLPEDLKRKMQAEGRPLTGADWARWERLLVNQGEWHCAAWPKEHGGPGWSMQQQYIFERELILGDAPPVFSFGTSMVAPAVWEFGSESLKQRLLPAIRKAEIRWCQGYSEPNSGSDLASLRCRAERDGDEYVINGQKTWTSDARDADWLFGLFRTDSSGKKQHGITYLLLDMKTPGITVEPIYTFDGGAEVNNTFFDDVRVPVANRVGEEHLGWTVAKFSLGLERFGSAEVSRSLASLRRLKQVARAETGGGQPLINDPDFASRITASELELRALEITEQRFLFGPGGPDAMGAEASMLKIQGTEVQQRIAELTVEALGYYALPYVPEQLADGYNETPVGPPATGFAASYHFNMRKTTIYGGSNEIQKNIISKAVLGL